MQRGRGGRVPGAEGYSAADVRALLACIDVVLPTGANEWERVLYRYRRTHAEPNGRASREVSSLKTKYRALINSKKSTGDANCPAEVRDAKRIQRKIADKVNFGEVEDDESKAQDQPDVDAAREQLHSRDVSDVVEGSDDEYASDEPRYGDEDNELGVTPGQTLSVDSGDDVCEHPDLQVEHVREHPDLHVEPQDRDADGNGSAARGRPHDDEVDDQRALRERPTAPRPPKRTSGQNGNGKRPRTSSQTLGESIQHHLHQQSKQREVAASERFLIMQLETEQQARRSEQKERRILAQKLERFEREKTKDMRALQEKIDRLERRNEDLRDRLTTQLFQQLHGPRPGPQQFFPPQNPPQAPLCDEQRVWQQARQNDRASEAEV